MTGLAALGASSIPSIIRASPRPLAPPAKIALQLYTVRDELAKNIPDTLSRVAGIGFDTVETAFWPEKVSVKQAGKYLRDAGLKVSSAHVELPVGDKKAAFLETAEAFQCKRLIWHGRPEDRPLQVPPCGTRPR